MSDQNQKSLSRRAQPARSPEGLYTPDRSSQYGEKFVQLIGDWRKAMADEGSFFVAHNPVNDASTTLAGHAAPVLVDADDSMTKPFVHLRHGGAITDQTRVYLDMIEIEVVTAGASGTAANWAAQLDKGATRVSSGGTALTKVNPNMQSDRTSVLDCLGGAVVTGAESPNVRHLGHGVLRPTIEIAGDKKIFVFGANPQAGGDGAAAAKREQIVNMPPVILGPTDQFLLALYAPSQASAGVYKLRVHWHER